MADVLVGNSASVGSFFGVQISGASGKINGEIVEFATVAFGFDASALPVDVSYDTINLAKGVTKDDLLGWGWISTVNTPIGTGVITSSSGKVLGVVGNIQTNLSYSIFKTYTIEKQKVPEHLLGGPVDLSGMIKCFAAFTPITLKSGFITPIENIAIGDSVLAFASGTTSLTPARVRRLFHNITEEWIELNWLDPVTGGMRSLTATPGHVMATPEGGFAQLIEMIIPPSVRDADFGVEPLVSPRPSGSASRGRGQRRHPPKARNLVLKSELRGRSLPL